MLGRRILSWYVNRIFALDEHRYSMGPKFFFLIISEFERTSSTNYHGRDSAGWNNSSLRLKLLDSYSCKRTHGNRVVLGEDSYHQYSEPKEIRALTSVVDAQGFSTPNTAPHHKVLNCHRSRDLSRFVLSECFIVRNWLLSGFNKNAANSSSSRFSYVEKRKI